LWWQFRVATHPATISFAEKSCFAKTRDKGLMPTGEYSVYLVRCRDGSLYTGIAKDVTRRIAAHEQGTTGAKYLRGKGPLELVFQRPIGDRGLAQRVEYRIKRLSRVEKEALHHLPGRIDTLLDELVDSE
jgi:putative endonuclease